MNSEFERVNRILYPTDLSENANYAFEHAVRIANCYGAKITILYVLEDLPPNVLMIMQAFHGRDRWEEMQRSNRDEILQSIRDRIQAFCAGVASNLPECPFVADEILVETGHPVERILHYLDEIPCDMVVMGSRGHGLLKEALLGSTSQRVLRRSQKPVLIVPLATASAQASTGGGAGSTV
jgi:nucleotide-binding universal stress UspA family protein